MSKKPEQQPQLIEKLTAPWSFMKKSISGYAPEDPIGTACYGTHIFPAFSTKKATHSSIIAARTEDLASLNISAKSLKQAFQFAEEFSEAHRHPGFLQIHKGSVYSDRHSVGFACEEVLGSLAQIMIQLGTQSISNAGGLDQFPDSLSLVSPYLNNDCICNGFACVFEAIAYLEKNSLSHGFINPSTIFVTRNGFRLMPPIAAVALGRPLPQAASNFLAPPVAFTAPEVIFQKKVAPTSDVFSAAITCAACHAPGILPPQVSTPMLVYSTVLRMIGPTTVNEANYTYYTQDILSKTSMSPNPYAVVSRGIQSDLAQRSKASELITLAFFNTPGVRLLRDLSRGDLSPSALNVDPKHSDPSQAEAVRRKIQERLSQPLPTMSRGQYVDILCPLLISAVSDNRLCVKAIKWTTDMLSSLRPEDVGRSILPVIAPVVVAFCNKDLKPQRTPKILKGKSSKHGADRGTNANFECELNTLNEAAAILVENLSTLLELSPNEWAETYLIPFICSCLAHNDNYVRASIFPALVSALPHVSKRDQLLHYINIAANEGDMNTKINFVVFLGLSVDNLEVQEIYSYLIKPLSAIVQGQKDERLSPRAATAINNIHVRCEDYDILARVLLPIIPPLAITPNMTRDDVNLILDIYESLTDSFISKYRGSGEAGDYISAFEEELINKESNKDLAVMGVTSRPEPMAREVILAHNNPNPVKHEDWGSSIGDLANINFDFNRNEEGNLTSTAQKYTQPASVQSNQYSAPQQQYTAPQTSYSAPQDTYAAHPPANPYSGGFSQYSTTTSSYNSPYSAQQPAQEQQSYNTYGATQNSYSSYNTKPQATSNNGNFDIFNF